MSLNKPAKTLCTCTAIRRARYASSTTSPRIATSPPILILASAFASFTRASYPPLASSPARSRRRYATVNHNSRGPGPDNGLPAWPDTQHPTPYQIFGIAKGEPYTKQRFYELVKLYHPDKHSPGSSVGHLPEATRTERYRLIVAANTLLSDPTKRGLYDAHGVGWAAGHPQGPAEGARHDDREWYHRPGSAARNATWEDWERWYAARDGRPQDPLYMSNGVFATLVVGLCMVGAFYQMGKAEEAGAEYVAMRDHANRAIGQHMARNVLVASGQSKDQRVDTFLRDRESLAYTFEPSKFDKDEGEGDEAGLHHRRPEGK